jgi:AcrR family transcriptional regulator
VSTPETRIRPQRADAQRNYDALLAIGADLLAEHGANLPFEEVARVAVVGKGTLYRHFPTRDHLIAAVLRQRFDQLADEADELLISTSPSNAVNMWLRSFDRIPERFRGLSARVGESLADDSSAVSTACIPMKEAFARLIHKAQADQQVRDDVDPVELLGVVAALPAGLRDEDGSSRYIDVILRGLRT